MITPQTLFQSFWIVAGMWMDAKLFWMCIHEFKKRGNGLKYLRGELKKNGEVK